MLIFFFHNHSDAWQCFVYSKHSAVSNSSVDRNKFVECETFAVITIFRSVNNSTGG